MAIMNTCCCCCGVRYGAFSSAVYSLVIGIIGGIYFTYSALTITYAKEAIMIYETEDILASEYDIPSNIDTIFNLLNSVFIIGVIILVLVVITSIVAIIGVNMDSKGMLIPYIVAKGFHLLWYIYYFIVIVFFIVSLGKKYAGYVYLAAAILLTPFFIGDLVCLLCVISQYQEYSDGRGRLSDVVAAQVQTTVTVQQHYALGNNLFAGAPPSYYPIQQDQKGLTAAI